MTLHFPNRFIWLITGIVIFVLLYSGCQPIQLPAEAPPGNTNEPSSRADLTTDISQEVTSPNGEWIATTIFQVPRAGGEYYQSLVVTHASGASSYTLVEGWFTLLPGYKTAGPLAWSADGERFYYTNRHQPDGCGLLYNGSDLIQVELANGRAVELLPADTSTKLGLAPDETHVAYQATGTQTLVIRNFDSGEMASLDLADLLGSDQMGAIVWSPDSSTFAFAVAHNPCSGGWADSTSIYTLNVSDLSLTPHLEHDERLLIPVAWPEEGTLLVEKQVPYDQLDKKRSFGLDLATGTVTPIADQ